VSFPDTTFVGHVQASHGAIKGSKEPKEEPLFANFNVVQAEVNNIQPLHRVSITVSFITQLAGEGQQLRLNIPRGCFPYYALKWDSSGTMYVKAKNTYSCSLRRRCSGF
jgi:hypothetical protein